MSLVSVAFSSLLVLLSVSQFFFPRIFLLPRLLLAATYSQGLVHTPGGSPSHPRSHMNHWPLKVVGPGWVTTCVYPFGYLVKFAIWCVPLCRFQSGVGLPGPKAEAKACKCLLQHHTGSLFTHLSETESCYYPTVEAIPEFKKALCYWVLEFHDRLCTH